MDEKLNGGNGQPEVKRPTMEVVENQKSEAGIFDWAPSYCVGARSLLDFLIPADHPPCNTDTRNSQLGSGLDPNARKELQKLLFLGWPPNAFAFTSTFFETTGSYAYVTDRNWLDFVFGENSPSTEEKYGVIEKLSEIACREFIELDRSLSEISNGQNLPSAVVNCAKEFIDRWDNKKIDVVVPGVEKGRWWNRLVSIVSLLWSKSLDNFKANDGSKYGKVFGNSTGDNEKRRSGFPECPENGSRSIDDVFGDRFPKVLLKIWELLLDAMQEPGVGDVDDVWGNHNWTFPLFLLLHDAADETCKGWGIRSVESMVVADGIAATFPFELNYARDVAATRLQDMGTLATICPSRSRILPKRHTPQVGITLRSISLNLAYHASSVDVRWVTRGASSLIGNEAAAREDQPTNAAKKNSLPVLLLPWPLKIRAVDFEPQKKEAGTDGTNQGLNNLPPGLFKYSKKSGEVIKDFQANLKKAINSAKHEAGPIKMVILPELCLNKGELEELEFELKTQGVPAYISGTRLSLDEVLKIDPTLCVGTVRPVKRTEERGKYEVLSEVEDREKYKSGERVVNAVVQGYLFEDEKTNEKTFRRTIQLKHHRWKMNDWQIRSYQLGAQLHPAREWWEDIPIARRRVNFVNFGDELTTCALVCEDLSRQDPIADLLRTVGPSLVVAILLDGPQNRERWAARYASVLADDPGSSVIALTAFGMVKRYSVPSAGKNDFASRVVALWSDRRGAIKEISLEKGAAGIVLSLAVESWPERTLDHRLEPVGTYTLTFGGVHQVYLESSTVLGAD